MLFSEKFACPVSGFTISEIEPRLFSFNNPHGACPTCDGLGTQKTIDEALIVPEQNLTLRGGAIAPWAKSSSPYYTQTLEALGKHFGFKLSDRWNDLPAKGQNAILRGTQEKIAFKYDDGLRSYTTSKTFEGIIPNLERRWKETDSAWAREEIERYMSNAPCPACDGYRLKPEARAVKINGCHIGEVTELSIRVAGDWFDELPAQLNDQQNQIAVRILKEIRDRLKFLNDVGLDYLTLSRNSGSLSGGESQRIRLASQIGSGLTGVLYVLDEPSIGLHQRDNARLLETLKHLRDIGNTVIVVEHDEDAILTADYVVDIGPMPGVHGGEIIAQGTPGDIMANPRSITGKYLSGELAVEVPSQRRNRPERKNSRSSAPAATISRMSRPRYPLGVFTAVTGVSGGGKSTFLIETLYKAAARRVNNARENPGATTGIDGLEHIDKVIDIDQSPIGRTPRSNPATYTGAFTPIRDWFAGLPEAKARGYQPGRFSFNVKGGRCEACQGDGVIKIEMHFLPDVYVTCDVCHGKRYNRETLEVTFKGKSIADVLDMTVEEGWSSSSRPCRRARQAAGASGRRPGLHQGRPAGDHAVGRRGAAGQAGQGAVQALDRPHALHSRRTDHRPAFPRCRQAAGSAARTGRPGQHGGGHRAQSRGHQDRRLGHRLGPEGGDGGGEIVAEGTPEDAIDITENDKAITLTAELPGMSEEEVDLTVSDGVLTLKGEKNVSHESKQDHSVVIERNYGSFYRSFPVPDQVDQDEIAAKFDKGVLTVTMPKKPGSAKTERRIKVRS
jgi:excinuclease ABC subunit A